MKVSKANFWLARALREFTRWYFVPQWPRERLCRWLFRPDSTGHFPFVVPLNGVVYEGDLGIYQDWRIFFLGSFERETINLLTHVLKAQPGAVLLDVGANSGLFTVVLAQHCAHVVAFEPFPPLYQLMRRLVALNHIENVTMHMVGLGQAWGKMPFYPPSGSNTGVGSFLKDHQNDATVAAVNLNVARGDEFLADMREPIVAIKIDTEGFERFVLAGLRETLMRHRPMVVFEMSNTTAKSFSTTDELVALFPQDYLFFSISEHTSRRTWRLKPVVAADLFQRFGNVLACPSEKRHIATSR